MFFLLEQNVSQENGLTRDAGVGGPYAFLSLVPVNLLTALQCNKILTIL